MDSWAYKVDGEWTYGAVNCSDGSETTQTSDCVYPLCEGEIVISGCTDSTAFNYNMNATIDDGSCIAVIEGCMNPLASNYDETANTDNGSCIISGCMDSTFIEYNADATIDDGSCLTTILTGCMDDEACNYNVDANTEDESCVYPELYYDCDGNCLMDIDGDLVCDQVDNCPDTSNTDQIDTDLDDEGDICDYDDGLNIDGIELTSLKLVRMYDILGQIYQVHPEGKILFYLYENGKVVGKLK
jgi:hypothetical protein